MKNTDDVNHLFDCKFEEEKDENEIEFEGNQRYSY